MKDYIIKRNKEEKGTGISPEHRELDDLLQDICVRKQEAEASYAEKKLEKTKKIEEEKGAAEKNGKTEKERLQWKRPEKRKVLKVVLNYLRQK